MSSAIDRFQQRYSRRRDRSDSTAQTYARRLNLFRDWLKEDRGKEIEEATTEDVRDHLDWLHSEGYAEDSLKGSRSAISQYWQVMDVDGDNPVDGIVESWTTKSDKEKATREKRYYLTREQVADLIENVPEPTTRNEIVVKLLYQTGCRRSELATIRVEDVDREGRTITVWDEKDDEPRVVAYQPSLDTPLSVWLDVKRPQVHGAGESPYLLPTRQSEHISGETIRKVVKTAAENAGIQDSYGEDAKGRERALITPHVLRHTHAVHAAENGVPAPHLKQTLGHTKIDVTQIYLEIAQDDAVEMLKDRGPSLES
jgi:integrase/recombinase XerD